METIRLGLRLPAPFFFQPFNLVFFPGSVLYERAVAAGLIKGREDSGYDLHYREGLQYSGHAWKTKNLYLNALMYTMEGKVTQHRLGILPRFLVRWMLHPGFVRFHERHLALAKIMIWSKTQSLRIRSAVGIAVKRTFTHPEAIYTLSGHVSQGTLAEVFGLARS